MQDSGATSPSHGVPALNNRAIEGWVQPCPQSQGRDWGRKGAKRHLVWLQNRLTLKTQGTFHSMLEARFHNDNSYCPLSTGSMPGWSPRLMPIVTRDTITNP